jgi:hypothetical protein
MRNGLINRRGNRTCLVSLLISFAKSLIAFFRFDSQRTYWYDFEDEYIVLRFSHFARAEWFLDMFDMRFSMLNWLCRFCRPKRDFAC